MTDPTLLRDPETVRAFYGRRFGDPTLVEKLAWDMYDEELSAAIAIATGPINTDEVGERAARRLASAFAAIIEAELDEARPSS